MYLITDQDNTTWRGVQWGPGVTHEEGNDNYHFAVYHSPQVACFMYPCYEGTRNPKLWLCAGERPGQTDKFRTHFAKLTTSAEFNVEMPTDEQRITFGILCAMNLVLNPVFREWAIAYLKGTDQTKETAHKVSERLAAQVFKENTPEAHDYVACAHAALASVMLDDPALFAANAAHRAHCDSLGLAEPLDLDQTAQIVNMLPASDIAGIL